MHTVAGARGFLGRSLAAPTQANTRGLMIMAYHKLVTWNSAADVEAQGGKLIFRREPDENVQVGDAVEIVTGDGGRYFGTVTDLDEVAGCECRRGCRMSAHLHVTLGGVAGHVQ